MIGPLSPEALICLDSILDAFSWTRETSSQDSKIYLDLINGDLSGSPREQDLIEAFLSEISETQKWRLEDLIKARIEERQQKQQMLAEEAREKAQLKQQRAQERRLAEKLEQEALRQRQETESRERQARLKAEEESRAANQRRRWKLQQEITDRLADDFFGAWKHYREHPDQNLLTEEDLETIFGSYTKDWFTSRNLKPLDRQQSLAVGADHKDVLVTARAGSGKTRTLVSRAAFLHLHCGVPANEIMLLTFNRAAMAEMKAQARSYFPDEQPFVMTFDGLAHRLTQPQETLAEDSQLERHVRHAVEDCLRHEFWGSRIRDLMLAYFRENWDEILETGSNLTPAAFLEVQRSLQHQALDQTFVKSHGEKMIANTLIENDIAFKYEEHRGYWNGVSYKPDFSINTGAHKVVIEYFGIRNDSEYDQSAKEKRSLWKKQPDWDFIELSPSDFSEGGEAFQQRLLSELARVGVPCNPLTDQELFDRLRDGLELSFVTMVKKCIESCRKLGWNLETLKKKTEQHSPISNAEAAFLEIVAETFESFIRFLENAGEIDYPGIMWRAIDSSNRGASAFVKKDESGDLRDIEFMLVDEFQDLTPSFMELIKKTKSLQPKMRLFCVGDDWQAINGWNGASLKYFQEFATDFPRAEFKTLDLNYRSSANVVAAGNAVMEGQGDPGRAHLSTDGRISVTDLNAFEPDLFEEDRHDWDKFTPAILRLIEDLLSRHGKIKIQLLSATNYWPKRPNISNIHKRVSDNQLDQFQEHLRGFLAQEARELVSIGTVHSFKGKEADAVIVWDALPNKYPLIHPHWIFDRIFGREIQDVQNDQQRLFYVATTRAKKELIFCVQGDKESRFVTDLIGHNMVKVYSRQVNNLPPPARSVNKSMTALKVINPPSGSPTVQIKDILKRLGYKYNGTEREWQQLISSESVAEKPWQSEEWFHPQCAVHQNETTITITYKLPS